MAEFNEFQIVSPHPNAGSGDPVPTKLPISAISISPAPEPIQVSLPAFVPINTAPVQQPATIQNVGQPFQQNIPQYIPNPDLYPPYPNKQYQAQQEFTPNYNTSYTNNQLSEIEGQNSQKKFLSLIESMNSFLFGIGVVSAYLFGNTTILILLIVIFVMSVIAISLNDNKPVTILFMFVIIGLAVGVSLQIKSSKDIASVILSVPLVLWYIIGLGSKLTHSNHANKVNV
jgi:hypothetical protein